MYEETDVKRIETIVGDATKFSIASYFAKIFDLLSGVVIRRILGPMVMGIFAELMLIFQYAKHYHLGTYESLDREIPYFNGRGDFNRVEEIKDAGFSFSFIASIIVGGSLILISNFLNLDKRLTLGLHLIAILIIAQSIITLFIIIARTHHKFTLLSRYNFLFSMIGATLTICLVTKFGLYGLLYALILTDIFAILFFLKNGFYLKVKIHQNWKEIGRLLKIGFPILLYGFIFTTLLSVDRFMIIAFLGRVQLGYYSIATMMAGYLILLPNLLYTVLFPRFYEAFGREGDIKKLEYHFLTPTYIIAYLLPLIIGLTILILPLLIKYLMPQYWASLIPSYILLLGTFFISLLGMSSYLLIALNKQNRIVIMGTIAIIVGVLFNYLFIKKLHFGLEGVALSMLITYFLYSIFLISFAFSHYTKKVFKHMALFLKLYFPIVWIGLILYWLYLGFNDTSLTLKKDIINFFIQSGILLLGYLPLFYYINKKTLIINKIIQIGIDKLGIKLNRC